MDYKKIDRLRKLDEMHYRGFITQEEEAERKALLTEIQEQARRDSVRGRERTMDAAGGGRSPSAVSPEVSGKRKLHRVQSHCSEDLTKRNASAGFLVEKTPEIILRIELCTELCRRCS